jgi:hypothetical protein
MTDAGDQRMDDAVARAREAQFVMHLGANHCSNMRFEPLGGFSLMESMTGLPMSMRVVRCKHVDGQSGGGSDLARFAVGFYNDHCVGCRFRNPNGQFPTLGVLAEEFADEAAAEKRAEEEALADRHQDWQIRAESRARLRLVGDAVVDGIVRDLAFLDPEPGVVSDPQATAAAKKRLTVFAQRSPEIFSTGAVDALFELVELAPEAGTLSTIRILATHDAALVDRTLAVALGRLRNAADADAGRCITAFADRIAPSHLDSDVVRSLVRLAGNVQPDYYGLSESESPADPSALRAIAAIAPDRILAAIDGMLPGPTTPTTLILPAQASDPDGDGRQKMLDRSAAADAIVALSQTHPELVAQTLQFLLRSLQIRDDILEYNPASQVVRAVAVLAAQDLTRLADIEASGTSASEENRRSLVHVLDRLDGFVSPDERRHEVGDRKIYTGGTDTLLDAVLPARLRIASGNWGAALAAEAARGVETLVSSHPRWGAANVFALLGTLIALESRAVEQPRSRLVSAVPGIADVAGSGMLADMEKYGTDTAYSSAGHALSHAVRNAAAGNPSAVAIAVLATVQVERDTPVLEQVLLRLIPVLGAIGAKHGEETGLLRRILHPLYGYLVDTDIAVRATALGAWTEVAASQPVPAALSDLLPAFLDDPFVMVIRKVMSAARRLQWSREDAGRLLVYAVSVMPHARSGKRSDLIESTAWVILKYSLDHPQQEQMQLFAIQSAADLDGRELEDIVGYRQLRPRVQESQAMAAARLKLVAHNFRYDHTGHDVDEHFRKLLAVGPGLSSLTGEDLTNAALALGLIRAHPAAKYAEIPWRLHDPETAVGVLEAIVASLPDDTAHRWLRWRANSILAWAKSDVAAAVEGDFTSPIRRLPQNPPSTGRQHEDSIIEQIRLRVNLRCALLGTGVLAEWNSDAVAKASLSDRLTSASKALANVSDRDTETARTVRFVTDLGRIGAHLVAMEQADLDADVSKSLANARAVRRRIAALGKSVEESWSPDDPARLTFTVALDGLDDLENIDVAATLRRWATIPLPLLLVESDKTSRLPRPSPTGPGDSVADDDVAVVLFSLDGRLITGPAVVRPDTVYELSVDVRPGAWPEWATELEGELLTVLGPGDIELPSFRWSRPFDTGENSRLHQSGTLLCRFKLSTGQPAPRFTLALRWRGTVDGKQEVRTLDVAAHREIRIRPFDHTRDKLTSSAPFDERLLTLFEQLRLADYPDTDVQAFGRLFTAICRAGLDISWEKKYRKGTRVTEREFHDDLFERLLDDPEIGGRLERGSPLALGFLDVRHDGITAELKVERRTAATEEHVTKYVAQPAQYASADGRRISILAILDLSQKTAPVGTPENYVFFLNPKLHGLQAAPAGSAVAVVIINGAAPTPSSFSRRKAAVLPPPQRQDP